MSQDQMEVFLNERFNRIERRLDAQDVVAAEHAKKMEAVQMELAENRATRSSNAKWHETLKSIFLALIAVVAGMLGHLSISTKH